MPFEQSGGVRYFVFNSFQNLNITHAIFTRRGGYSPNPWQSLNMGGTVGDDPERVKENKRLAFRAINRDINSIFDVWQVHSSKVICVDQPRNINQPYIQADAMVTNNPEVTLFMRFADCVPVFLIDPVRNVVSLIHSGWEGTVNKIIINTVLMMEETYGSYPGDIFAGIGPSICVEHYEIGTEVEEKVRESFGDDSERILRTEDGQVSLDLWKANRLLLEQSGVKEVEISNLCTATYLDDWYSHRGEFGKTGRFGAVIGLGKQ